MNQEQILKAAIEDPTGYYVRWITPMYGLNNKTDQCTGNRECRASVEDCINERNLAMVHIKEPIDDLRKLEDFISIHWATIEKAGGMN